MGNISSVQVLPARVSKAGAKAVAGALFDSDAFAQHQDEDGLVDKAVFIRIAQEREITHERLVMTNIVQFVRVKQELDAEWGRMKGTERLNAIESFNLTKVKEGAENQDKERLDGSYRQQKLGGAGEHVSNQEELVAAAETALAKYPDLLAEVLKTAGVEYVLYDHETHEGVVMLAPLKGQERIRVKARDEYNNIEPGPGIAWIYDAVRATVVFDDADQVANFIQAMLDAKVGGVKIIVGFESRGRINPEMKRECNTLITETSRSHALLLLGWSRN